MFRLGDDESGTWLFAPRGAAASYADHGTRPLPVSFLTLVPNGNQWWMATWMRDNEAVDIDLYVDIVHPPKWTDVDRLVVIDLDLDVIRRRGGEVSLDDEDELELHAVTLQYPPEIVTSARAAAQAVLADVEDGIPPFGDFPAHWLAMGRAAVKHENAP